LNVVAIACLACVLPADADGERPRPNVLFIAVDDLRPELGCYGVKEIKSPNIDRLAGRGLTFTRAYCQQAVCNPSRASLLTGLRPDSTRVWDLVTPLRDKLPDVVTLPQHFKQHGYYAVGMGKIYHNTFPDPPSWTIPEQPAPTGYRLYSQAVLDKLKQARQAARDSGMSEQAIANRIRGPATDVEDVPDNRRFDGALCDLALEQLRKAAAEESPFFVAVGFILPHLPWTPPKKYWELYDPAAISPAANDFLPRGMPAVAFGDRSMGGMYELMDCMDFKDAPSPFEGSLSEARRRRLKHGYYASVSFIDAQIGRLLDELDRLGLADDTIVVLWGDHGWKLGEHNGWCKQTNFEIDTRSPLIVAAPGAKAAGKSTAALAEFVDIYPTLCELAGLPVPGRLEGQSLTPLLDDPGRTIKDAAISQFLRRHEGVEYMGYSIRTDRHRYVEWIDRQTGQVAAREIYDHQTDADENENIANLPENEPLVRELAGQLWEAIPRPVPVGYRQMKLEGWTVFISERLLQDQKQATDRAIELLDAQLKTTVGRVPGPAVAMLRTVPLWFSPVYPGTGAKAEYHPNVGWLRANGRDPALAKAVEFTNIPIFEKETRRMPLFALHELAHAYHDQVLGFDNPEIEAAYRRAVASKSYESVKRQDGKLVRAYALTDAKEYFAETSEAFFGANDFCPSDPAELEEHDPEMCKLLERLWNGGRMEAK
jgi:iduronate 2-sulfatase